MNSQFESEVHNLLVQYLGGKLSLDEFKHRFSEATWDKELGGLVHASELASEIEHRLAELSNEDWTEDEFRELLKPFAETFRGVLIIGTAITVHTEAAATNTTITPPVALGEEAPNSSFDIRLVAACA